MLDVLPIPLPWYVVGPLLGLTVAGFYAVTNKHLGISGACPGTASTTLGAGSLMGIVLVAGMITGIALRDLTVREPRPASSPLAESSVQAR